MLQTLSIMPPACILTATTPLAFKARLALFIDEDPELANEIAEMIVDKSDLGLSLS